MAQSLEVGRAARGPHAPGRTAREVGASAGSADLELRPCVLVDAHVGRHLMLQCIRGLLQQRGKTVVMVTHHVQWLHLFDRVLMMEEGKIVKQGSPKEEHILERARSASASSASGARKNTRRPRRRSTRS